MNATMFERIFYLCLLNLTLFTDVSFSEKTEKQPDSLSSVTLQNQIIRFTTEGDLFDIQISHNYCDVVRIDKVFHNQNGVPLIRMETGNDLLSDNSIELSLYKMHQYQTDTTVNISFFSSPLSSGIQVVKEYIFHKNNYSLVFSGRLAGEDLRAIPEKNSQELQITFPDDMRSGGDLVYLDKKIQTLNFDKLPETGTLKGGCWIGIHSRFWGCFIQSSESSLPFKHKDGSFRIELSKSSDLRMYYGPIVYNELKKADHHLGKLLYQLPFWMRWLSFGFLFIYDALLKIFHSVPLSLLLLSICVKIILAPLFRLASIWQKQVNHQSSLLQPRLDEIKKRYKGEEQTRKTLEAYKELGISPLYSLKSLLSAAIQIPVFFAAYHMLSEHIALSNTSFLWIKDLSFPDHLFKLPFTMPFFGEYFNVLPFVMTFFTICSSWIHTDPSLSVTLQKKQRKSLYWMAALFFLLLYTSPAGMVIYWTMNNILAFIGSFFEFIMQKQEKRKNKPIQTQISEGT